MKIDEEFSSLIPPLSDEEYRGLEESILNEGCRDALIVWDDILIDGHNRYRICTEYNVPYETRQMEFESRDDVLLWIMRNQLSRRNLNDFQRIELVRKCEEAVKAQERRDKKRLNSAVVEKFPLPQKNHATLWVLWQEYQGKRMNMPLLYWMKPPKKLLKL